jgi:hypothetical protein
MPGILGTGSGSGTPAGVVIALQEAAPNVTTGVLAITAATTTAAGSLALVPKGAGTPAGGALIAQVPDATATAGNVRGANAVDWQSYRLASTQVASGAFAVIGGGTENTATGQFSTVAGGSGAVASTYGKFAMASGSFASPGDAQYGCTILRGITTGSTQVRLTADGTAPNATNTVNLEDGHVYAARILVAATVPGDSPVTVVYEFTAVFRRRIGAQTTMLVGGVTEITAITDPDDVTATADVSADAINGGIAVTATGIAGSELRWVATIQTTEVG